MSSNALTPRQQIKRLEPRATSDIDKLVLLIEEHRFIPSESNGYKVARQE